MTNEGKIAYIKARLKIAADDTTLDGELSAYLDMAGSEILNCMYPKQSQQEKRSKIKDVPLRYEIVQMESVINAFNHQGAEGETVHNENGYNRTFKHEDMVAYINSHVMQII